MSQKFLEMCGKLVEAISTGKFEGVAPLNPDNCEGMTLKEYATLERAVDFLNDRFGKTVLAKTVNKVDKNIVNPVANTVSRFGRAVKAGANAAKAAMEIPPIRTDEPYPAINPAPAPTPASKRKPHGLDKTE